MCGIVNQFPWLGWENCQAWQGSLWYKLKLAHASSILAKRGHQFWSAISSALYLCLLSALPDSVPKHCQATHIFACSGSLSAPVVLRDKHSSNWDYELSPLPGGGWASLHTNLTIPSTGLSGLIPSSVAKHYHWLCPVGDHLCLS